MAEAVKVIVRCRPMNSREKSLNCLEVINIDYKTGQCSLKNPAEKKGPPKMFTFDGAYGTNSTTEQIYADIGFPLVEGVTEGYNGTIFAYGQTGCGKSFSMQGISDPATQRGIIPRAFEHIFETINCTEGGTKYLVHASYLEIYNENIRDLLGKDHMQKLELKEHPDKGVYTQGLSMHPCKSVPECEKVMSLGWKNRSTGSTLMNAESSRSHSIFTIYMERCDKDDTGEEHIRAAKLNLVDLAGSERQAKTGATGDRLKEATKINLSLSALGNVISALVDGKSKHIPYRDSKLTRLLQDSLGGNTKTLMVACLSPADNNYDETLSTLRYANRAKNIKNKPKINEDPKDALLREYQEEINKLRAMLRGEIPIDLGGDGGEGKAPATKAQKEVVEKVVAVADEETIEKEKARLKEEYESEMVNMKTQFEQMKISKEKLEEEMEKLKSHYDNEIASVDTTAGSHRAIMSPGQQTTLAPVAAPRPSRQEANLQVSSPSTSVVNGDASSKDAQIPVKFEDGQVVYLSVEEVQQGLPPGAELLALDEKYQLVPMTVPVKQADGSIIRMSHKDIEEQGLPDGSEVVSVNSMKEKTPSPKVLIVSEKVPVRTADGEIEYMTQMEIGAGLSEGSVVMKEENGELVPLETVSVKTIEGTIESKTQEEIAEGLPIGYEIVTEKDKQTIEEPSEPEVIYAVQLADGEVVHMTQQQVDQGLSQDAEIIATESKKSKDKVIVKTSEGSLLTVSAEEVEQGLPPGMEIVTSTGPDVEKGRQQTVSTGTSHAEHEDVEEDHEDPTYIKNQVIQHAVHLATVKTIGEQGAPVTPSASPTGEHVPEFESLQQQQLSKEALKRLEELQQQMVGGEQSNNQELKEKHRKKKKHVEERKRKLAEALAQMEGEEIMLEIYDNIQDELKATQKRMRKEKEKNESLERDIKDLEAEFEFDRIDYLDTIRKQEQTVKWLESVVEKIHPCLRRDCNYVNLDKIKANSKWDENQGRWILPKMTVEKTKLPTPAGTVLPGASQEPKMRNDDIYHELQSEDRFLQKLQQKNEDAHMQYFKSNRQEQILNQRNNTVSNHHGSKGNLPNGIMNGHHHNGKGNLQQQAAPWLNSPMTNEQLKAAQVHGQVAPDDVPVRKPTRLDALPDVSLGRRKHKKKLNTMEQY